MDLGLNSKMCQCQDVPGTDKYAIRYNICGDEVVENVEWRAYSRAIIPLQHAFVQRYGKPQDKMNESYFLNRVYCPDVNSIIGNPIFPGSITIVTGESGTGKTTFLLQVCGEHARYRKVGYVSGEQNVGFLGQICNRCDVIDVDVGNIVDVDDICDMMTQYNVMVVDSFPCIKYNINKYGKKTKTSADQFILEKLATSAQANNCALFIVLHSTKAGQYKGSTFFKHTVDTMINLRRDGMGGVIVELEKSRCAPPAQITIRMGSHGFNYIRTFIPLDGSYMITGEKYLPSVCERMYTTANKCDSISIRYDKEYAISIATSTPRTNPEFWLAIRSLIHYYKRNKHEQLDYRLSKILRRKQKYE